MDAGAHRLVHLFDEGFYWCLEHIKNVKNSQFLRTPIVWHDSKTTLNELDALILYRIKCEAIFDQVDLTEYKSDEKWSHTDILLKGKSDTYLYFLQMGSFKNKFSIYIFKWLLLHMTSATYILTLLCRIYLHYIILFQ